MAMAEEEAPANGLVSRVLGAWADLRGSMRGELTRGPSEGRLLFYVVLSGLIWFAGRAVLLAWGPKGPTLTPDEFRRLIGAALVSSVFYRTIALYVVAALAGAVARAFGGAGSWRDSRAAVFWGSLVAAPAILAATMFSLLLTGAPGRAAEIASMLGAIASAWVLAHCLAEAHGFASTWKVLGVIAGLVGTLVLALYLLGRAF
ncbi:MAG: YIP1 family protein [Paracoccaceae bacterium]|nr:YIP1 family protein [Paracoccaceae bacterium]